MCGHVRHRRSHLMPTLNLPRTTAKAWCILIAVKMRCLVRVPLSTPDHPLDNLQIPRERGTLILFIIKSENTQVQLARVHVQSANSPRIAARAFFSDRSVTAAQRKYPDALCIRWSPRRGTPFVQLRQLHGSSLRMPRLTSRRGS